jgi:hypothetical protein
VIFSPDPEFDALQRVLFSKAVQTAYRDMDQRIYEQVVADQAGFASCSRHFISRFAERQNSRAFVFTLNQDILMERFFQRTIFFRRSRVFRSSPIGLIIGLMKNLCTDQFVAVPDAKEIEKARESFWEKSPCGFMYVKLHGSYGWRSTNGADKMIIGHANWEGLPVSLFSSGICRYSRRRLKKVTRTW